MLVPPPDHFGTGRALMPTSGCPPADGNVTLDMVELDQRSGDLDPELWFPCVHHEGARDVLYPSSTNPLSRPDAGLVRATTGQLSGKSQFAARRSAAGYATLGAGVPSGSRPPTGGQHRHGVSPTAGRHLPHDRRMAEPVTEPCVYRTRLVGVRPCRRAVNYGGRATLAHADVR